MKMRVALALAAACSVSLLVAAETAGTADAKSAKAAAKNCVNKAGQGTGSTDADARFQAWEAVLQATSWSSWGSWMSSSKQIGTAPGYAVSKLRQRCVAGGGLGRECTIQATLCQ